MYQLKNSIKNTIHYSFLLSTTNAITHIGYGIDNNYVRCCSTSIVSFCKNNPQEKFHFHIISSIISKENLNNLQKLAEKYNININISIYIIDNTHFNKLPTQKIFPISMYFRFILPIVNSNLSKILYIDADIICLNNINELLSLNLNQNIIAAVPDTNEMNIYRNKELNLKNHLYFNSGMMLINIPEWNKYNTSNNLVDLLNTSPYNFKFPDQDALNLILTQKIAYLPKKFNYFNGFYPWHKDSITNKEIILLHFTSSPKPWDLGWEVSSMSNDYNRDLYKTYENQTPWKNASPVYPKHYRRLRIYSQDLYHHGYYLSSIKYYILYLLTKLKK